jgi:hypothetical protein
MFEFIKEMIEDIKHNRELYRSGKANKDEVRSTTVGWRHDPGQVKTDPKDSPSGNPEYHTVVRSKKSKRGE